MKYKGSCHCGRIAFEVEGGLDKVNECNCSICSRKGALHWFVPRESFALRANEADLSTYTFNKHAIKHRFCSTCGCAPFGEGETPSGDRMVAVNARCLEDVDLSALEVVRIDGRSF